MSTTSAVTKLVFVREFSERDAFEARERGYLSHVLVEIDGLHRYPVVFYDPIRLRQDLELSAKHGRAFIADPGMIILTDITIEAMQLAVQRLAEEGFFAYITPLSSDCAEWGNQYSWPPESSAKERNS